MTHVVYDLLQLIILSCYLGEDPDYNRTAGGSFDISATVLTGSWDPAFIGSFWRTSQNRLL